MEVSSRPLQGLVARLNVPAFAVDDQLTVIAWNECAEGGGRVLAAEALGRPCYDVFPAVDVQTGRPCRETCPLLPDSARRGWAHNRVLSAPWNDGDPVRLQCFAVKAALPDAQSRSICLLEPPGEGGAGRQSRMLDLVEALYPALAADVAPAQAIHASLEALKRISGAESAELYVPGDGGGLEPALAGGAFPSAVSGIMSRFGADLPGWTGDAPHLIIAEHPQGEGPGARRGWSLCAPVVSRGRMAGMVAVSSGDVAFQVAEAARVLFPLSLHLAGHVAAFNAERRSRRDSPEGAGSAAPQGPRLHVRCLGPLEVSVEGQMVPGARFKRQKALQALAYLAIHRGRPVSRETLGEVLWPGSDPQQAGHNLRTALHDLRRAIEPDRAPATGTRGRERSPSAFVRSEGDSVVLDASDRVWVDAEAFAEASRHAAALARRGEAVAALAECERAIGLYRGEFLGGEASPDWATICREQYRELFLGLIKQATRLRDARGDLDEAIALCHRALEVDRSREEFHRDLMRLFLAAGCPSDAVRQYRVCRRALRLDLGTVPGPETTDLFRSLVDGAGGPRTTPR